MITEIFSRLTCSAVFFFCLRFYSCWYCCGYWYCCKFWFGIVDFPEVKGMLLLLAAGKSGGRLFEKEGVLYGGCIHFLVHSIVFVCWCSCWNSPPFVAFSCIIYCSKSTTLSVSFSKSYDSLMKLITVSEQTFSTSELLWTISGFNELVPFCPLISRNSKYAIGPARNIK